MNIKKSVLDLVISEIEGQIKSTRWELVRNRHEINKLAERQRVLKKSIQKRLELLRILNGKPKRKDD